MLNWKLDRRTFLARAGQLGLLGVVAPACLAGCGGGGREEAEATTKADPAKAAGCNDLAGLTPEEVELRQGYEYVELAGDPTEACKLCAFWEPAPEGQTCGGCTLFAGPVHPDGSCNSWAEA